MTNYELDLIRHGDHKGVSITSGLTANGISEARKIGNELDINNTDDFIAFVVNTSRSIGTVALAMLPKLDVTEIETISAQLIRQSKIVLDDDLDYRPMSDEQFKINMMAAFNNRQAMGFIVDESDKYTSNDLSTYSTMSRLMAKKILLATGNSIYCPRELMSSSLRAKITSLRYGQKTAKDYATWYMNSVEWNSEARTYITKILTDGKEYLLRDSYGEVDFDRKMLINIGEKDSE